MVKIQDINKLARLLSKMRIEILGLRQIKKGVKVRHPITKELISLLTGAIWTTEGKDRLDKLRVQFVNILEKIDWDKMEDDDVEEEQ